MVAWSQLGGIANRALALTNEVVACRGLYAIANGLLVVSRNIGRWGSLVEAVVWNG